MSSGLIHTKRFPFAGDRPAPTAAGAGRLPARRLALVAASLALFILALVPAVAVGAQSAYPPNTVVSTYFDARYCGDGAVSVVTDSGGNLIDVCTSTGVRIYPVYPDYTSGLVPALPAYTNANAFGYSGAFLSNGSIYANGGVYSRQYTDNNSNCTDGQVTQTAAGYFCTTTGIPAYRVS